MNKKFQLLLDKREKASLDRPAWTSTQETGMFHAYRHKHINVGGACIVKKNHFTEKGK